MYSCDIVFCLRNFGFSGEETEEGGTSDGWEEADSTDGWEDEDVAEPEVQCCGLNTEHIGCSFFILA